MQIAIKNTSTTSLRHPTAALRITRKRRPTTFCIVPPPFSPRFFIPAVDIFSTNNLPIVAKKRIFDFNFFQKSPFSLHPPDHESQRQTLLPIRHHGLRQNGPATYHRLQLRRTKYAIHLHETRHRHPRQRQRHQISYRHTT